MVAIVGHLTLQILNVVDCTCINHHLDTRSMTSLVPKTELKLCWLSKKSRGSRYIFNPTKALEDRTRFILGVEEVGGEVKGSKRFFLDMVTQGERLIGPRVLIIN